MTPAFSKPGVALAALIVTLALSGCGDDDDGTARNEVTESVSPSGPSEVSPSSAAVSSGPATPASSPAGTTIDVTFDGDTVTPNGDRLEVELGQDVTLVVTADEPGEIHVHSTPEQELEYDAGTSTLIVTNLDRPGIVDIESHDLDKVIVQLEVR